MLKNLQPAGKEGTVDEIIELSDKLDFPDVEVLQLNEELLYQIKQPFNYSLSIGEGYTYIPLRYSIIVEADPSFDEVGEMTFLHVETGQEVDSPLYTTDFENATLYVCLQSSSNCNDDENDVTFLIDFNELRIPLHQHIKEQLFQKSA